MDAPRIDASFPLSPMQEGMLFNTLLAPSSGVDLLLGVVEIEEALDEARFERAWERVVESHPALRTSLRWKGLEAPVQDVHHEVRLPFHRQDWTSLPEARQEERWKALMESDRAAGFDLATPPLTRLTLVRLGPERQRVLWPIHHALVDTLSMTTLLRQVFGTYDALGRGEAHPIEPTVTQSAYSEWFAQLDVDQAEPFWRAELAGLQGPSRLGIDRGEPRGEQAGVHHMRRLVLSESDTTRLKRWTKEQGTSLNTLLQGAWAVLLARASGERRVVFGAVKSCRTSFSKQAGEMVGLVLNTLPFVLDVDPEADFLEWLGHVRERWVALREFEHTPLVRMKEWSEVGGRLPLFESVLCFDPLDYTEALQAGGGDWSTRRFDIYGQPDTPMVLNVYGGRELQLRITYDPRRFEDDAIERLLEQFRTLLESAASAPGQQVSELSMLSEGERRTLLEEWNDTARDFPSGPACLHELFEAQAARTPEAVAVVMGEESLGYRELAERSHRLSNELVQRGVGPDQPVGLCVERSLDMIVGVLGILGAGGAYVPLDPGFPPARLAVMVEIAGLTLVVTHGATREVVRGLPGLEDGAVLCLDGDRASIDAQPPEAPRTALTPTDLAYVLFTSGSTGRPKGVAMPHGPLVNLMRWQFGQSRPDPGSRTLQFAPLGFDVSCQEIFATLGTGGCLMLVDDARRRDPGALLAFLRDESVSRVFMPFIALQQLVDAAVERNQIPSDLREVITAGEALQVGTAFVDFFSRLPGCTLTNQYGPTECHVVTAHTLTGPPQGWPALPPIGRPIANARAYVLDPAGRPQPVGVVGELYLGGAAVGRGYLGDSRLSEEKFVSDPFVDDPSARLYRTGDLARYRGDGELEFLGRVDDQVKLRGFRVEPGDVENALLEHPGVRQAALVVREEGPGDQRLTAYVVTEGAEAPAPADLRVFLKQRLPVYMLPSDFVPLDALPLSPNGKVDHRRLPAPVRQPRADRVAPRNEKEELLAGIWRDLLKIDHVGVFDDFFEMGGHSILAMLVVNRIRDAVGVEVELQRMFDDGTVAGMAEHVETLLWALSPDPADDLSEDQEEFLL